MDDSLIPSWGSTENQEAILASLIRDTGGCSLARGYNRPNCRPRRPRGRDVDEARISGRFSWPRSARGWLAYLRRRRLADRDRQTRRDRYRRRIPHRWTTRGDAARPSAARRLRRRTRHDSVVSGP